MIFVLLWNKSLPSNGDGEVEDGKVLGSLVVNKKVRDDGRSNGGVTGLTHTNQTAESQETVVILLKEASEQELKRNKYN